MSHKRALILFSVFLFLVLLGVFLVPHQTGLWFEDSEIPPLNHSIANNQTFTPPPGASLESPSFTQTLQILNTVQQPTQLTATPGYTLNTPPFFSPTALTMLPSSGSAVASELLAQPRCGSFGITITFTWLPGSGQSGQAVDVSIFNNDFLSGTFDSSRQLPVTDNTFIWDGLADGVTYVWRVRAQVGSAWIPSETAFLTTPFCGGDSTSP